MDPELTAFKTMFDYKLNPEVYNFHLLDALIKAAEKEGITNFPIHVKLDTGMHRLGFAVRGYSIAYPSTEESERGDSPVRYSLHFVGSDSSQFDAFTRGQTELFRERFGKNCRPPSLIRFSLVISVIRQESNVSPKHSTEEASRGIGLMESAR